MCVNVDTELRSMPTALHSVLHVVQGRWSLYERPSTTVRKPHFLGKPQFIRRVAMPTFFMIYDNELIVCIE